MLINSVLTASTVIFDCTHFIAPVLFVRLRLRDPTRDAIRQVIGPQGQTKLPQLLPRAAPLQIVQVFCQRHVRAQRGQTAVQERLLPLGCEALGQPARPAGGQSPLPDVVRDGFEAAKPG